MYLVEEEKKIEYCAYVNAKGKITEKEKMTESGMDGAQKEEIEKINIGQIIKEGEREEEEEKTKGKKEQEEIAKNFKEEIMEAIKGITQGYTISLELKGIGYQAKISEEEKKEEETKREEKKEQKLEKNIKKMKGLSQKDKPFVPIKRMDPRMGVQTIGVPLTTDCTERRSFGAEKKGEKKKGKIVKCGEEKEVGEGYKEKKRKLIINVGLSHNVEYELNNKEIKIKMTRTEDAIIKLIGIAKKNVSQIAAEIYKIKKPEPYKGKGIRYNGEKYLEKKAQRTTKKKA
jgi:ribosomal protein L6P/L9E